MIYLPQGPTVSISDKFLTDNMFTISHGPQFRQSQYSYTDSAGLSQSATHFMSIQSSAGLPFSVQCALLVEPSTPEAITSNYPSTSTTMNLQRF
jgi:hypothetical protein